MNAECENLKQKGHKMKEDINELENKQNISAEKMVSIDGRFDHISILYTFDFEIFIT